MLSWNENVRNPKVDVPVKDRYYSYIGNGAAQGNSLDLCIQRVTRYGIAAVDIIPVVPAGFLLQIMEIAILE
jgi:hypothetical protein